MENYQRELISEAGGKCDKIKHGKIFLRVVERFRGKRLAPLPSRLAPYPEEWQQMIRIAAIPKILVNHLTASENAINENRLVFLNRVLPSAHDVISEWAGEDEDRNAYTSMIASVFEKCLFKVLLYKPELYMAARMITEKRRSGVDGYLRMFPVEFLLRLTAFMPDILTAVFHDFVGKSGEKEQLEALFRFVDCHQAFLAHLEVNVESILRTPMRESLSDDALPEVDLYCVPGMATDEHQESACIDSSVGCGKVRRKKLKRKCHHPVFKGTAGVASP